MRTSTAYFAGAGTVIAAIVVGLGGGLLIANIINPPSPKLETTKLEQRMAAQPIPIRSPSPEAAPQPPVREAAAPAAVTGLQSQEQEQAAGPPSRTDAADPRPAAPSTPSVAVGEPAAAPAQAEAPAAPKRTAAAPEDAMAKARDADLRRDAAQRRSERRSERRQRWAEQRRRQQRVQEHELREVEESVRQDTESRPLFAEPVRDEMPRIRLFDVD